MKKIIAQRTDEDVFLVMVAAELGVVVDLEDDSVGPRFNTQSILARGYWNDVVADSETQQRVLELVG